MLRLPTKKMKKLVCVSGCNRILHDLYSFLCHATLLLGVGVLRDTNVVILLNSPDL